jgi:hypothetical protein
MIVGFTTTYMQSVPITTNVVSSNPVHGEVYSIQHYVIKFVSDLRQIGGFLRWFSSTNKTSNYLTSKTAQMLSDVSVLPETLLKNTLVI